MTTATITPTFIISTALNSSNDLRFVAECECGWKSRQLLTEETAIAAGRRHVSTKAHRDAIAAMLESQCLHGIHLDDECDDCKGELTQEIAEPADDVAVAEISEAVEIMSETEDDAPKTKIRMRMSVYLSDHDISTILGLLESNEPDGSAALIEKLQAAQTRRAARRAA